LLTARDVNKFLIFFFPFKCGADILDPYAGIFIRISLNCKTLAPNSINNEKSARRRRKHCTLAVVRCSQKFSPRCRPPSRGRGTAKF